MNDVPGKTTTRPISNPSSALARELMLRTLEQLAVVDNDPELAIEVKRRRAEASTPSK
jgi:hypothetical protein